MNAILTRRSIRRYTSQEVPDALARDLLEAAMCAPSAGNQRPWHFLVVRDRALLDAVPRYHPYAGMMREANLGILVIGDPQLEKHPGYWVQDCSAATENILLMAESKGLGAVWLGVYPRQDRVDGLKKLFGIPDPLIPLAMIAVGYPAEKKPAGNRYDDSRVYRDKWGKK